MIIKNAILDFTRTYRYLLERRWGNGDNMVNFVLLNPSTADESLDDPTIKGCISFSKSWGYDGFYVTNLFAFRATKPKDLKQAAKPIGDENDAYLTECAKKSKSIIVAWGNHGSFLERNKEVIKMISAVKQLHCLGLTKLGNPKHPLYVKRDTHPLILLSS